MELKSSPLPGKTPGWGFVRMFVLLVAILTLFLGVSWLPGNTLFSNDGPLSRLMSPCHRLPERFFGCWQDLDGIGYSEGSAFPGISFGLQWLLKPVWFSKLYAPLSLLTLGLGAWLYFRRLKLAPLACVLGGLAAVLNSNCFSTACWGLGSHVLTVALSFLALAALVDASPRWCWLRVALAGAAMGLAVAEGADVGALFSVLVAGCVAWQAWTTEGPRTKNLVRGAGQIALIALLAAWVAARALSELVATNISGVVGTKQDAQTRAEHWDWATQWSLPKRETLGLIVPGLFGYRMETPEGGGYWGMIGRDVEWDRYLENGRQGPPPRGFIRYTGSGYYAGLLVVLAACWVGVESFRRKASVFSPGECKWIRFWVGLGLGSLLLAFGRFAPFYHLVYALPYFNTIRNPTKFLHWVSFALVILFAYGVDGWWRRYLRPNKAAAQRTGFRDWWAKAPQFEKRWVWACVIVLATGLFGWMVYASAQSNLEEYLRTTLLPQLVKPTAAFSVRQVGWFILFFALAAGVLALIMAGTFGGARAGWGGVVLGLLLVTDLGRANLAWIQVVDYERKLAGNPVVDILRDKPYEHRVSNSPFRPPPDQVIMAEVYKMGWMEHLFPYYGVQSLDLVQLPRVPEDLKAFSIAMKPHNEAELPGLLARRWQLTNTRYLFGGTNFFAYLSTTVDPLPGRFRIVRQFSLVPHSGAIPPYTSDDVSVAPAEDGAFALIEYTGALPRAKLYTQWQIETNNDAALAQLANLARDPAQSVLVANELPPASPAAGGNEGTVEFASYAPKDIVLKTSAGAASVLLLNDRFDPRWIVRVDGQPKPVLRCNYLMRGVYLEPGAHTVEFRFQPPVRSLYVSLAGLGLGLALLSFVVVVERRPTPTPVPAPARPAETKPPGAKPASRPKQPQRVAVKARS